MGPLRRLLGFAVPYRRAFALGLACSVVSTGISLVSPLVLRRAVDDLGAGVTTRRLVLYGGLLLLIGGVGGVFRFWTRRILIGASRDIEYDMRNAFYAHLQKLPVSYFHTHRTGDLMSRATSDLGAVRMMVGPAIMYTANTLLTFVAALGAMLAIDRRLTLLSIIPLPFVSVAVKYFGSAIHHRFERIQAQLSEVSAVAQASLSGVRVVRAYRQEAAEIGRFEQANLELVRRNRALIAIQGLFFPSMSLLLGLGAMLVLWLGSREVIRGRITLGEFVAFFSYLTMLSWPVIAFGWVTNMLQRGMASWTRMLEVMDAEPVASAPRDRANDADRHGNRPAMTGDIELRRLTFSYGDVPVLNDVSALLPAGRTTAIVGATGSGKSTLISLLTRLHEPPPGTILVGGVDVLDMPIAVVRGAMGVVQQEPFLFSDTIADNIAFGLDRISDGAGRPWPGVPATGQESPAVEPGAAPDQAGESGRARMARVRAAAEVAQLDKDVSEFPKGYETFVGERGITLSGGQKQRTAIARAVALDPSILILDDALSAVDTSTEDEILERLGRVMRDRTSIIVAHRISTVRRADQILVLDRGHIVERGTHDDLIALGGQYAELHRQQLLEEELAAS